MKTRWPLTPRANLRVASPGYFDALGQRVLKGRSFGPGDTRDGPLVVVINDMLARRWWPGASAVGHSLRIDGMQPALVVGVVENARQRLDEPPGEEIYFPLFQSSQLSTRWLVRSSLPPPSSRSVRAPLSRPWIRSSRSMTSARWNRSATICSCRPASRHRWSVSSPCWRW